MAKARKLDPKFFEANVLANAYTSALNEVVQKAFESTVTPDKHMRRFLEKAKFFTDNLQRAFK